MCQIVTGVPDEYVWAGYRENLLVKWHLNRDLKELRNRLVESGVRSPREKEQQRQWSWGRSSLSQKQETVREGGEGAELSTKRPTHVASWDILKTLNSWAVRALLQPMKKRTGYKFCPTSVPRLGPQSSSSWIQSFAWTVLPSIDHSPSTRFSHQQVSFHSYSTNQRNLNPRNLNSKESKGNWY